MINFIYITIGVSGSGKTTWARDFLRHHLHATVLLDSDSIREELWGDAADQQNPAKVFELMFQRTILALNEDKDVVYCATNLNRKKRMNFIKQVKQKLPDTRIIYVIFNVPIKICIEQDKTRERTVGEEVIWRQVKSFQFPSDNEGQNNSYTVYYSNTLLENQEKELQIKNFGSQDTPYHTETLYKHTIDTIKEANKKGYSENVITAAALHDYGKIYTKTYDEKGIAHYYGHENVSAYFAMTYRYGLTTCRLIALHMLPFQVKERPPYVSEALWQDVLKLHECDVAASQPEET